jgi:hypothetical protein
MRSIRKVAYATVLCLSMFSLQPTLASAEDRHGTFKLSHEVHWQNSVLRPGDYYFSLRTSGPQTLLTIQAVGGAKTDAMLLVSDVESAKPDTANKLVLVSRGGNSFVSTMELAEYDMTMRFAVPAEATTK